MLPYNAVMKPIQLAEMLCVLPILLFGLAALWLKRVERNYVPNKAPILSLRSQIGLLRWAQAFCLGMLFAFGGASTIITSEHVRYSHAHLTDLQITGTSHPSAAPHGNR